MNILYIAYSCSPYGGSEEAIGFNIPIEMSKNNNVYVITKEESRKSIEQFLSTNKLNVKFFYVDIRKIYKKIFKGCFYSGRLNIWNREALMLAKKLNKSIRFNIIHQITPIELRAIGKYYTISNAKFVVGPLGGGEYIPTGLRCSLTFKQRSIEIVRKFLNVWKIFVYKVSGINKKIDYVYFANNETKKSMNSLKFKRTEIYNDIGVRKNDIGFTFPKYMNNKCCFLICGRLNYRKGHLLLIDAIQRITCKDCCEFKIVGDGPEYERIKKQLSNKGLSRFVELCGSVPYLDIKDYYRKSDVLIMPSLRETGGTVILEALSNGLPVISGKAYGASTIIDDSTGILFDLTGSYDEIVDRLTSAIEHFCYSNILNKTRELCLNKSMDFSWENKALKYEKDYKEII